MKVQIFLVLTTGLLLAVDQSSPEASRQPGPLEGTWSVVSMQYQGKKVANEVFANTRLEISADRIVTRCGGKVMKEVRYKLLPKQKEQPQRISTPPPDQRVQKGQIKHGNYCAGRRYLTAFVQPTTMPKGIRNAPRSSPPNPTAT